MGQKFTGDPRNKTGASQTSPQVSQGVNVATKTSGSYGTSKEGNVSGKGSNKSR